MIAAVGFGNTEGDTPSVFIVDIDKCTPDWRACILNKFVAMPQEWSSLEKAKVPLPATVDMAVFRYYNG